MSSVPTSKKSNTVQVSRARRGKSRVVWPTRQQSQLPSSSILGRRFSPSPNPPDITYMPWNTLVLCEISGPGLYTYEKLAKTFRAQVDPNGSGLNPTASSFRWQFRLLDVSVWNLTGRAVSLSVYDDISATATTDVDVLGGWVDCGGANYFPCIGYKYPASHSAKVHHWDQSSQKTVTIFTTTASSDKDSILSHLKILWRFEGHVAFKPTVQVPELQQIAKRIEKATSEIKNLQPSLLKKVVDGVEVAAIPVSLAVGEESSCVGHSIPANLPGVISGSQTTVQYIVDRVHSLVLESLEAPSSSEASDFAVVDDDVRGQL